MLAHAGDYLPEAIAAVKSEALRRHLETPASPEDNAGATEAETEPAAEVEPAEEPQDEKNLTDPSLALVIVSTFRNVVDAGLFKARLEAAGIEACMPEEYTPQMFWNIIPNPLGSVTVQVAAKDIEAARAFLADYTDTSLTAGPAGLERKSASSGIPQTAVEETDPRNQKQCVSCHAAMPVNAALCPKCGWTQPDRG